jgi:hypothetical protein
MGQLKKDFLCLDLGWQSMLWPFLDEPQLAMALVEANPGPFLDWVGCSGGTAIGKVKMAVGETATGKVSGTTEAPVTSPYVIRNCSYDRILRGRFSVHHPL